MKLKLDENLPLSVSIRLAATGLDTDTVLAEGVKLARFYPRPYPMNAMSKQPDHLEPIERAREKQESRDADDRALASGQKSRDDLRRENGHFVFRRVRISLRGAKPLE